MFLLILALRNLEGIPDTRLLTNTMPRITCKLLDLSVAVLVGSEKRELTVIMIPILSLSAQQHAPKMQASQRLSVRSVRVREATSKNAEGALLWTGPFSNYLNSNPHGDGLTVNENVYFLNMNFCHETLVSSTSLALPGVRQLNSNVLLI